MTVSPGDRRPGRDVGRRSPSPVLGVAVRPSTRPTSTAVVALERAEKAISDLDAEIRIAPGALFAYATGSGQK